MDEYFLAAVTKEIAETIVGSRVSAIHHAANEFSVDFGRPLKRALVVTLDPANPGIYLSSAGQRKPRRSVPASPFSHQLSSKLVGSRLVSFSKTPADRAVVAEFELDNPEDGVVVRRLVFFLTGRSSDVHLLDPSGAVEGTATGRTKVPTIVTGQEVGEQPPRISMDLFGEGSGVSPLLKSEFIARCREGNAEEATASMHSELTRAATGLVFARFALEEIGRRSLNPNRELLLSCIELHQAAGMMRYEFGSLSEAAEAYYQARGRAGRFQERLSGLKQKLSGELKKAVAALTSVEADLLRFQEPDRLKRCGDLLLANLKSAIVEEGKATVLDYFDPDQQQIQIELKDSTSLKEAAAMYYGLYRKACRSLSTITARKSSLEHRQASLASLLGMLEGEPSIETIDDVADQAVEWIGKVTPESHRRAVTKPDRARVGRRFVSSDGYEILVGRGDQENDTITFRIAGSRDLWMHAADYPGSHVVIRNPRRLEIPTTTIREAAQLAAFYSQARKETKAAVHYTQKKFVTKPPRAKPGLVRLSSYKTILVVPRRDIVNRSESAANT